MPGWQGQRGRGKQSEISSKMTEGHVGQVPVGQYGRQLSSASLEVASPRVTRSTQKAHSSRGGCTEAEVHSGLMVII